MGIHLILGAYLSRSAGDGYLVCNSLLLSFFDHDAINEALEGPRERLQARML